MKVFRFCKTHMGPVLLHSVCILGIIVSSIFIARGKQHAYDQTVADRWSNNDITYHQITAFAQNLDEEEIARLRNGISVGLQEASYTDESVEGKLWIDAYSARTEDAVSRSSELGVSFQGEVTIFGVGGNFFQFHPQNLISGCCFSSDDVMHDRVLLDKELAWKLFGAYDIAGKQVQIAEKSFTVAGVYDIGDDKDAEYARSNRSCVYMEYALFHSLYEDVPINCYEVVLPNAVKNFARNLVKDNLDDAVKVVDNTLRFKTSVLLKKYRSIKRNLMHTELIQYPYWETMAVATEWELWRLIWLRFLSVAVLFLYWMTHGLRFVPRILHAKIKSVKRKFTERKSARRKSVENESAENESEESESEENESAESESEENESPESKSPESESE